jgi:hypothetical protein
MNSTKYQLKLMKDVIGTNSEAFGKTGAGTSKPESSAFLIFFEFFENALPSVAWELYVQLFESFPGKQLTSIRVPSKKLCPFQGGLFELGFVAVEIESDANRWIVVDGKLFVD